MYSTSYKTKYKRGHVTKCYSCIGKLGLIVYWKTTTATEQADKLILDEEPKKIFPSYNWRIFDAYKLTKPLVEYETNLGNSTKKIPAMWDKIHFYDWVYRGLNEVLLVDILKV